VVHDDIELSSDPPFGKVDRGVRDGAGLAATSEGVSCALPA
jgi:hypothetical protein